MAGKDSEYRIFVGGLAWDVNERQLEDAFGRFGKVLDCQSRGHWNSTIHVMLERETGRPRGFGFLTFGDRRAMDDAIREMHGREFGDRVISVNKAQPRGEDSDQGYGGGGGYSSGGRGNYGGDRPAVGQDDCFKCGRPGHWARDCPGGGGGGRGARPISPRSRFGGIGGGRGDRYMGDRDRYMDDSRYDRGRNGDRDRFDSRDDRYASRGRYVPDRYPPPGDRFLGGDRFGASDRYPPSGYGKDRGYDRYEGGPRGSSDRYGVGGPAARYEGRSYRDRPAPYDRPRRGGRASSFDRY